MGELKTTPTTLRARLIAPLAAALGTLAACAEPLPPPPETHREDVTETLHGVALTDPYRWLEDQESPATRDWIGAQNDYAETILGFAPPGDELRARLERIHPSTTVSAPLVGGGRYFSSQRRTGDDLQVLYVRRSADADDEVLVDPHALSADRSLSVEYMAVSADGSLAGYAIRDGGADERTLRFIDVDTGEHLDDVLGSAVYTSLSILPDRSGAYYASITPQGPRVRYHAFDGGDAENDRVVFGGDLGPDKYILSGLSSNGRYLLITVLHGAAARTELYFRDLWTGDQIHTIVNDIEATFSGHIAGDTLFVLTDWAAPNRRVFAANLREPSPESWTEIIAEAEMPIESLVAAGGRLLVRRLEDVQPRITVYEPDGFPVRDVELPGIGDLGDVAAASWESDEVFFGFSSLARPETIYRYRVSDGEQQVWATTEAGFDPGEFVVRRVTYPSADGTEVPMFVAHHVGTDPDGARPTLLTGYGGFNLAVLAWLEFNPMAVAWMERGGVWAVPGLRGGGEFGERWHRAGMLENKQNVFDDFIAAAEWLIANDYTRPDRLAIMGRSNGGLLVGAALTQRPDLFGAVLCGYPLLDMLRYHRFLIGELWVPEYGSADDPVQFEYLAGYSPYHRVEAGVRYPAVMLYTGDADTRVAPLHARKMTALLQASTASGKPVVLMYDTKAGHSGGRPRSATIDEQTAQLRFLFWQLDVDERY